jgi:ribosome-associated protein
MSQIDFTSSPSIQPIPGVLVAAGGWEITYSRSSGPGGQNVNKVNTRAQLSVRINAIVGLTDRAIERLRVLAGSRLTTDDRILITADAHRSQERNREAVLDRLRQLIADARWEPKPRKKTKPSKAAKQRRLESKRRRSETKSRRRSGGDDW